MASKIYYSKNEFAHHQERIAAHEAAVETWKATCLDLNDGHAKNMKQWQDHLAAHQAEQEANRQRFELAHEQWQQAYAAWENDHPEDVVEPIEPQLVDIPDHPEDLEPQPPALPPEPDPVPELGTYQVREISEPEEIEAETGTALVMPPSLIVTGPDGNEFGVLPGEFDKMFEEVK